MRYDPTIVCAVPASCFSPENDLTGNLQRIQMLLRDIATCERRISKNVNLDEERKRHAACGVLLDAILEACSNGNAATNELSVVRLGHAYGDFLIAAHEHGSMNGDALAAARVVVGPGEVKKHLKSLRSLSKKYGSAAPVELAQKINFVERTVLPNGAGIAETTDSYSLRTADFASFERPKQPFAWWHRLLVVLRLRAKEADPAGRGEDPEDWRAYDPERKGRGRTLEERLRDQIKVALTSGPAVPFSGQQRHETSTKVLNEFITKRGRSRTGARGSIGVIYADGSEGRPFPLRCLNERARNWKPNRVLRVALMSMRHLDLDRFVDINWFRNVEIPKQYSLAHADEYCFRRSAAQLQELRAMHRGQRLRLYLYHTGFEPAVIGFYRSVVVMLDGLAKRKLWLEVVPMFRRSDGTFEEGASWPN